MDLPLARRRARVPSPGKRRGLRSCCCACHRCPEVSLPSAARTASLEARYGLEREVPLLELLDPNFGLIRLVLRFDVPKSTGHDWLPPPEAAAALGLVLRTVYSIIDSADLALTGPAA